MKKYIKTNYDNVYGDYESIEALAEELTQLEMDYDYYMWEIPLKHI